MNPKCPFCDSDSWKVGTTGSGYQCYKCKSCGRKFNERAATPFHWLHFSNKDIMMAALLYTRCGLSSYQIAAILRFNGVKVSPRSIRRWPQRFGPIVKRLYDLYKIRFSRISPSERRKRGGARGDYSIVLRDSKGDIVTSYIAPEQSTEDIKKLLASKAEATF